MTAGRGLLRMSFNRDVLDLIHKRLTAIEGRLTQVEATLEQIKNRKYDEHEEAPKEVGTAEAAEILGVSKDTVLKLKAAGLLEYRNTAPPDSSRAVYAFTLRSVMELRTSYDRDDPAPRAPAEPPKRRANERLRRYKHLDLDD
jgi:hypothetical protein